VASPGEARVGLTRRPAHGFSMGRFTSQFAASRHGVCPAWISLTFKPMPTLYENLRSDIIAAMKARDAVTLMALRTADAAIKRAAMDSDKSIDDALVVATLRRAVKNLADAKIEFEKGGRADLVAANETEMRTLEKYLPRGLEPARVEALIAGAIQETGAGSKKDMGKVIAALKKLPEAALLDFGDVSKRVQAKLP